MWQSCKDYFLGKRSALKAAVRLGLLLPLCLAAGGILLLGVTSQYLPSGRAPALFGLLLTGLAYWAWASTAIFVCALNEERHTWFAGMLLFLVPFQAVGVVRVLAGNLDALLGLVGA